MEYKIIVDSGCEMPLNCKEREDITRVPLTLKIGDREICDDGVMTQDDILAAIASSAEGLKTENPSPDAYIMAFDEAYEQGARRLYCVTLSAGISKSYESAVFARTVFEELYPDASIHIFNSRTASVGETMIMMKIVELEEKGLSFRNIVHRTESYLRKLKTYILLESLETLKKNGLLSKLNMPDNIKIRVKPICIFGENGEIRCLDQARSMKRAFEKLMTYLAGHKKNCQKTVGIGYLRCKDKAEEVLAFLKEKVDLTGTVLEEMGGISTLYAHEGGIILVI